MISVFLPPPTSLGHAKPHTNINIMDKLQRFFIYLYLRVPMITPTSLKVIFNIIPIIDTQCNNQQRLHKSSLLNCYKVSNHVLQLPTNTQQYDKLNTVCHKTLLIYIYIYIYFYRVSLTDSGIVYYEACVMFLHRSNYLCLQPGKREINNTFRNQ